MSASITLSRSMISKRHSVTVWVPHLHSSCASNGWTPSSETIVTRFTGDSKKSHFLFPCTQLKPPTSLLSTIVSRNSSWSRYIAKFCLISYVLLTVLPNFQFSFLSLTEVFMFFSPNNFESCSKASCPGLSLYDDRRASHSHRWRSVELN